MGGQAFQVGAAFFRHIFRWKGHAHAACVSIEGEQAGHGQPVTPVVALADEEEQGAAWPDVGFEPIGDGLGRSLHEVDGSDGFRFHREAVGFLDLCSGEDIHRERNSSSKIDTELHRVLSVPHLKEKHTSRPAVLHRDHWLPSSASSDLSSGTLCWGKLCVFFY